MGLCPWCNAVAGGAFGSGGFGGLGGFAGGKGNGNPRDNGSFDGLFPPERFPGNTANHGGPMPTPDPVETRGQNDPYRLPIVNPGRDCNGKCNPCPPGKTWKVMKPGHGWPNWYEHRIDYHQNKKLAFVIQIAQAKVSRRSIVDKLNDITSVMLQFRESVRHNWNTYFQDSDEPMGPEIQEAFTLVEQGLFQGIVLCKCACVLPCRCREAPLPFIQVVPRPEMLDLEFQIGLLGSSSKVWDSPVRFKVEGSTKLEFVQFFDWNPYEQINMSLVQVYIARMDARPDLVGAHALVAEHEIRFLLIK